MPGHNSLHGYVSADVCSCCHDFVWIFRLLARNAQHREYSIHSNINLLRDSGAESGGARASHTAVYAPGAALRLPPPQSRSLRFLMLCIARLAAFDSVSCAIPNINEYCISFRQTVSRTARRLPVESCQATLMEFESLFGVFFGISARHAKPALAVAPLKVDPRDNKRE